MSARGTSMNFKAEIERKGIPLLSCTYTKIKSGVTCQQKATGWSSKGWTFLNGQLMTYIFASYINWMINNRSVVCLQLIVRSLRHREPQLPPCVIFQFVSGCTKSPLGCCLSLGYLATCPIHSPASLQTHLSDSQSEMRWLQKPRCPLAGRCSSV